MGRGWDAAGAECNWDRRVTKCSAKKGVRGSNGPGVAPPTEQGLRREEKSGAAARRRRPAGKEPCSAGGRPKEEQGWPGVPGAGTGLGEPGCDRAVGGALVAGVACC